ncbi:hypothetical protein ACIQ8G_03715 [Streptomyces sp. NPDC094154]|uniref:hypothetical protein n=1 Tax=Streptomyces sp. NPDC094154 TaxID=3366059 RepID=UPI003814A040
MSLVDDTDLEWEREERGPAGPVDRPPRHYVPKTVFARVEPNVLVLLTPGQLVPARLADVEHVPAVWDETGQCWTPAPTDTAAAAAPTSTRRTAKNTGKGGQG